MAIENSASNSQKIAGSEVWKSVNVVIVTTKKAVKEHLDESSEAVLLRGSRSNEKQEKEARAETTITS